MEAKITKLDGEFKTKKSVFYDVELENIPFEEGKRVKIKLDLEDAEGIKVGDAIKYKVDYNAKSASGNPYILVTLDKPEPEKKETTIEKTSTTQGAKGFVLDGVEYQKPKAPYEQALIVTQSTMSSVLQFCGMLSPNERAKPENDPLKLTKTCAEKVFEIAKGMLEEKK